MSRWSLCLALLCLAGCTSNVADIVTALNDRQVTSCIFLTGSYGPFVGLRVITATGGATITDCDELR